MCIVEEVDDPVGFLTQYLPGNTPHPHAFVSCLAWFGYLIHVLVWLLDSRDINNFNFREEKEKKNQQQLKTKASLCSDQC